MHGWSDFPLEHGGIKHTVFVRGAGPAVIILHELPGMMPQCVKLGHWFADQGFLVYMPLLFGEPGMAPSYVGNLLRICMRGEFQLLRGRFSAPLTDWVRALARRASSDTGDGKVGCIGMCLTGNLVLAMVADEAIMAPVMSQPAFPFFSTAPGIAPEEMAKVKKRCEGGLELRGYRFEGDVLSSPSRFERMRREVGDKFVGKSLPGNAHSIFTLHFVDEPGHPTYEARSEVAKFFKENLERRKNV